MNTSLAQRARVASLAAAVLVLLAGCSAADPAPAPARAAVLADYPTVSLLAPAVTDAGTSPTFAWEPVGGAVEYRLSVVGAEGPVWAWSGEDASVLFGGYAEAPADGVGALRLTSAAWWSVAAFDADGMLVAISEHRAVAPDASSPAPLGGAGSASPAHAQPAETAAPLRSACELLSDAEAETFLEGAVAAPGAGGIEADGATLSCSWVRADDEFLTLDLSIKPGVRRESWDESMEIMVESFPDLPRGFAGVGDDSYMDAGWGGTRLALIADDVYLSVRSGFTDGAEDATIALAKDLLARYLERAR